MYNKTYLFSNSYLRDYLQTRTDEAIKEIRRQDADYILSVSVQDYVNHLVEEHAPKTPLLLEENITFDHGEKEIELIRGSLQYSRGRNKPLYLNGTIFTYYIPFNGDSVLFNYKPSTYTSTLLEGTVKNQELILFVEGVDLETEKINEEFGNKLNEVKKWLDWVKEDVESFNHTLSQEIKLQITTRREKLLRDYNLASGLDYPLRKRDGIPVTYIVPAKRKTIYTKPLASTQPFKPEPTLGMEEYEHVLNVVQNMAKVMERSPKAFKTMGEEDIRQHFLVQLNGQYEGNATGETFNYEGKTDILIREENTNIFIAECKFWQGPSILKETIDQILRYLSWRDTKTAIFMFNRNKDLSNVLSQIPDIVNKHPNYKRELKYDCETGFRFVFHQNDDTNRELYMTLLVFDVPK